MQLDFFVDSSRLVAELRAGGQQFGAAIAKGILDGTRVLFEGSRGLLSELIYNRAIPTRARFRRLRSGESFRRSSRRSNVPAWRRTGTLLRNERFYMNGSGTQTTGIIENKTPYAQVRHDLDKPSPFGYNNRAPWRTEAVKRFGDRSLAAIRNAIAAWAEQR